MKTLLLHAALAACLLICTRGHAEVNLGATASEEVRVFFEGPQLPGQRPELAQPAFAAELKLDDEDLLPGLDCSLNPYVRYDSVDRERTLFDLHEAKCRYRGDGWRLKLGYDVEFWGVTEFVNPANVLNQRDITEDAVSKRRLGTPMLDLSLMDDWGTLDLYLLGYFKPLRIPGETARLRPALPIDTDRARYEGEGGRVQPEAAMRYTGSADELFVALSYFYGYERDPSFALELDPVRGPLLAPVYSLEHQLALELQLTLGNWLFKAEGALRRNTDLTSRSEAATAGLEYDLGTLLESTQTINMLLEYVRDTRTETLLVPFTNDVFAGVRFGANDARSSELTLALNASLERDELGAFLVEASTRVFDSLKASLLLRQVLAKRGAFADISQDDHLVLRLTTSF